jgi:superfamily II DNA or RNA helicase
VPLGVEWQQAHLVAHTNGGATSLGQMQAWCRECNLAQGSQDAADAALPTPRQWQAQALDVVTERLWQVGTATVHAAPGAGKTYLAGLVFRRLARAGLVERMVVVVPNRALQRQWAEALGSLEIHLDWAPRDGFLEHPETAGAVVTYQSLPTTATGHVQQMSVSTLLVLDEVHHVGEHRAWGHAVSRLVGPAGSDQGIHPAGVLNMTGTLFRSSGGSRIGSVRYDRVLDGGVEKYQAVADFSVTASALIGIELRPPDLYAYGGHVQLVDVRAETVVAGDIADLEQGAQVATAIREGFMKRALVHEFAKEALKLLSQQLKTIDDREPLKLLWVAENQKAARLAAEEIDKAAGRPFARLVISDEPGALETLRMAAREPRSCAIVAVRMVTEGFDCPQVSVIAYASATTAVLFLAQTMARAMRITRVEREDHKLLPAQVLIPDNESLRRAFAEALVGHFHILDVPDDADPTDDGRRGGDGEAIRIPRYELADMSSFDLRSATVLGEEDGTVPAAELQEALALCLDLSIPEVYAPRVAVAGRRLGPRLPLYTKQSPPAVTPLQARPADPRTLNIARRKRVSAIAQWMTHHVDHDPDCSSIAVFQGKANSAAGIPSGGRDQATPEQMAQCELWMIARVREHCAAHGCALPAAVRDELR